MICLRAIIYHRDVLDSSKDVVFFFNILFINIESQSCAGSITVHRALGWLSSSGSIKKKQQLYNFLSTAVECRRQSN